MCYVGIINNVEILPTFDALHLLSFGQILSFLTKNNIVLKSNKQSDIALLK